MSTIGDIIDRSGGVTAVARRLGCPIGTVSAWATRGRVPAERVLDFERVTGVPRHDIRPDLYPPSSPDGSTAADGTPGSRAIGGSFSSGHDGASVSDVETMADGRCEFSQFDCEGVS